MDYSRRFRRLTSTYYWLLTMGIRAVFSMAFIPCYRLLLILNKYQNENKIKMLKWMGKNRKNN